MFSKKNLQKIVILGSCFIGVLNATEVNTEKQSKPREILTKQDVNNLQLKLTQAKTQNNEKPQKADLVIISENNPQYLRQMIESVIKYAPDIEKIYVLKDPCYGQYRDLYESIKRDHNQVEFIKVNPSNFKSMLESIIQLAHNKYVLISKSNVIFTSHFDLDKCMKLIDQEHSPLFYLTQELANQKIISETCTIQNTDNLEIIDSEATEESTVEQENLFMWQFKNICNKNNYMALYKKSDILEILVPANYTCLQELLEILG